MEQVYSSVMEQWERLQASIGLAMTGNNKTSSKQNDALPSSGNVSDNQNNGDKKIAGSSFLRSATSKNIAWWLTSLLFGVSSTLVYHWVRAEVIRRSKRPVDSRNSKNLSLEQQQQQHYHPWKKRAKQLVQWTRNQIHELENFVSERSPSEVTLQVALGTSLLLPDHLTVPWVMGCLVVSNHPWWWGKNNNNSNARKDELGMEKYYPPFLFLCFCPGKHRFQLWFTWMGLQLMDHGRDSYQESSSNSRTIQDDTPKSSNIRTEEKVLNAPCTVAIDPKELAKVLPAATSSSRYLEVLVHNVSHTDILLSLAAPDDSSKATEFDSPYCLCRPRFSFMDMYCRRVRQALLGQEEIVQFPRYERSEDDPRYLINEQHTGNPTPVGFALSPAPSLVADMTQVRVRGRDLARLNCATPPATMSPPLSGSTTTTTTTTNDKTASNIPINFVFFPLLATLLPRWRTQIEERKYPRSNNVKRVLILVTGVGTPRNWTHSVTGNSTEVCAQLMERFLKRIDPNLTVVRIHSQTNIFRYDENLRFVDKEFGPLMNAWRDAHAKGLPYPGEPGSSVASENPFNAEWRSSMSVTLSAADGSTARTHAIRESLRPFRPTYFHFWQLKTFWHETKIVDDDLEVHSYETMETLPAVDAERLRNKQLQMVVDEMKAFRLEITETLRRGKHDISKFWLRKTHKPVLAVLLVQSHGMSRPALYRGTNMEVSMPTGSLCAERNVIGSALAANPALKREDLKLIAVLAIPTLDEVSNDKSMRRVDSMASVGSTTLESNPDVSMERHMSICSEQDDWIIPVDQQQHPQGLDQSFAVIPPPSAEENQLPQRGESETTPVRKIRLFSKSAGRHKQNRSVVVQNSRDLNPLKPCGGTCSSSSKRKFRWTNIENESSSSHH